MQVQTQADEKKSTRVLRGLVIDNGIGSGRGYPDQEGWTFETVTTGKNFQPDLSQYDLLIVPNGTDHVAMFRIRDQVRKMLEQRKAVFCFCGWFLDWLPGNRWIHDNSHPTREMRHFLHRDPAGLMEVFDLASLDHNRHGISGWWACGYIETANYDSVVVKDTWDRAVIVADETTTPGFMFLTASGPVGNYSFSASWSPLALLYQNALRRVRERIESSQGEQ